MFNEFPLTLPIPSSLTLRQTATMTHELISISSALLYIIIWFSLCVYLCDSLSLSRQPHFYLFLIVSVSVCIINNFPLVKYSKSLSSSSYYSFFAFSSVSLIEVASCWREWWEMGGEYRHIIIASSWGSESECKCDCVCNKSLFRFYPLEKYSLTLVLMM
jgi:hypothetical protein